MKKIISVNSIIIIVKPLKKNVKAKWFFLKIIFPSNQVQFQTHSPNQKNIIYSIKNICYYSICGSDSYLWRGRDSISEISWESSMINTEMPFLCVSYIKKMLRYSFLKR